MSVRRGVLNGSVALAAIMVVIGAFWVWAP